MVEIRLFGTFAIQHDGKPVVLSSRVAQSLFAYSILTVGSQHRREKLAGMFWPDVSDEKARAYFRHELWRIRKAFPGVQLLATNDIGISFNSSVEIWLDAKLLVGLRKYASTSELISALAACQGEFLPGFYDEWILQERENFHALYEQAIERLLQLLERDRRWHDILEWAERWILQGQAPETAYRYLMTAYDALGDRARVAAIYKRCVKALQHLDLEPSEQTRTLAFKRFSKLNIPIPLTSFIGREIELEEVARLLSASRLVTLTGSGGVGKSRLAIQVVAEVLEDFPDGVWFVDLAPVSDPALVPATLAGILDVQGTGGLQGSITEAVAAYLRFRKALVILDNCEHLIQASAQLAHSLLASCESLTILATSREVLRVSGEIPYRVPSLALPELRVKSVVETIQKTESAQLFLQRAAAILPGFALGPHNALLVAQICQRLDGIPLAIELAAARVNVLSLDQIARRLDDRFNLLTGGSRSSLPRHQTLRATIEWSYDLLTEKESLLFRRLAVFVGGWTLEAAEAVCSGEGIESGDILDLLSHLLDKSLVIAQAGTDGVRYRRLETIRQFASEKLLASGEQYILRTQHCDFFLDLGKHACQETNSLEKNKWKVHLEQDDDNFRAALTWCLTQENIEVALRLLGYWKPGRGHRYSEICDWFEKIRAFPNTMNHPTLYAKLLTDIGRASWLRRNIPYAESVLQESETIWLRLKENGELGLAETWLCLGDILLLNEEYIEKAQLLVNQSLMLYQKHGNKRGVSHALFCLGKIALRKFDFIEAEQQFMKSHSRWQELGDCFETVHALNSLGELARLQDDYDKAAKYYKQCLRINRELRDFTLLSITLFNYAWVLLRRGDCVEAKDLIEENLYISTEDGDRIGILYCFPGFAGVLVIIGKIKEAAHLLSAFVSLFSTSGSGPLEPPDQKEFDYYLKLVREQLDETTFALSWKEGSKMTIEQAVAFALKETNI